MAEQLQPIFTAHELHGLINSNFDEASHLEQHAAINFARLTTLADQAKQKAASGAFDFEATLAEWLHLQRSAFTKRAYRRAVECWARHLASIHSHPILVTAKEVDDFAALLRDEDIPAATARLYLSACSSFYTFLQRHAFVSHNYFKGMKLPRPSPFTKSAKDIPIRSIVDTMLQYLADVANSPMTEKGCMQKRRGARKLRPALATLAFEGLRIRAIPTMEVHGNIYKVFSKGKAHIAEFSEETLDIYAKSGLLSEQYPFKDYNVWMIEKALQRTCKAMMQQGLIPCNYSPHDFRHFFAVSLFKRTHNLLEVSARLGHSDVRITEIYLSSYLDAETQRLLKLI